VILSLNLIVPVDEMGAVEFVGRLTFEINDDAFFARQIFYLGDKNGEAVRALYREFLSKLQFN